MSESEPIPFRPRDAAGAPPQGRIPVVAFNRHELDTILAVYSRFVAAGEWRDYAMDLGRDKAVFAVFQRAAEYPVFRIEKCPKLARRQGAYSVVARTGAVLKRGHELSRVLAVLNAPKLGGV